MNDLKNLEIKKLFFYFFYRMDETDDIPLSKSTKILFNLIEIRLFDLSQVLQVGGIFYFNSGHKLSINQIK